MSLIYIDEISSGAGDGHSALGELQGHGGEITDVKFNPRVSWLLASSSSDKSIRLWNAQKRQQLSVIG